MTNLLWGSALFFLMPLVFFSCALLAAAIGVVFVYRKAPIRSFYRLFNIQNIPKKLGVP